MSKDMKHECHFILKSTRNTIDNYFLTKWEEAKQLYLEEGIRSHLALLIGQKNISIEVGTSLEMYNFIIYCII